jgi:hypothetical protein
VLKRASSRPHLLVAGRVLALVALDVHRLGAVGRVRARAANKAILLHLHAGATDLAKLRAHWMHSQVVKQCATSMPALSTKQYCCTYTLLAQW